jgi:hypothetical protein
MRRLLHTVDGYERCFPCKQVVSTFGVADLVAPLVYDIEHTQSGILLRHYKDDVSAYTRQHHGHGAPVVADAR